jgi:hypothetical protein
MTKRIFPAALDWMKLNGLRFLVWPWLCLLWIFSGPRSMREDEDNDDTQDFP